MAGGGGGGGGPGAQPQDSFLNFTPSRCQETASSVLKTDSVDTVFTFYYARKNAASNIKSYFSSRSASSRSAHPTAFLFYFFYLFILFSGRLSLETQYKIEFLVPGNGLRKPLEKTLVHLKCTSMFVYIVILSCGKCLLIKQHFRYYYNYLSDSILLSYNSNNLFMMPCRMTSD